MDRNRIKETSIKGISKRPLETEMLKSWAIDKMAKEKEKRTQPYANSPSFKKDFTFNEEKKQKRTPKKSKISKIVGKKPESEWDAILLDEAACVFWAPKATIPRSRGKRHQYVFGSLFFIVF